MPEIKFRDSRIDKLAGSEGSQVLMLAGGPGTGKTTLALEATAKAIEEGSVVYMDTGENFSPERFLQIGKKQLLDKVNLLYPDSFQQQKSQILALQSQIPDHTRLIIVDSLVSLYRRETDSRELNEIGHDLSKILSELSKISREEKIPIIVTGQIHEVEDGLSLVGGEPPKFWPDRILKLSKPGGLNRLELVKNRFGDTGDYYNYKIKPQGLETV